MEKWLKVIQKLYNHNINVIVDEYIMAFREGCPFKQYIVYRVNTNRTTGLIEIIYKGL